MSDIVEELAQHLFHKRMDPSDPETAFQFLLDLNFWPWKVIHANFDAAIDAAGQMYIAKEISRSAA